MTQSVVKFCGGFLLASALSIVSAGDSPTPGDYDRLVLGNDHNLVTGYFRDCTGECKFSCYVFFEGKAAAEGPWKITAYYPGETDSIPGVILTNGKKITLRLEAVPGGCWNVEPGIAKDGAQVLLDRPEPWLQIRVLREKSPLYSKPGKKIIAQLEKQQIVMLLQAEGDWLYVRKESSENLKGWLRRPALFPLRSK